MNNFQTVVVQTEMESKVERLYKMIDLDLNSKRYSEYVILDKDSHSEFCARSIFKLPKGVSSLSSGQPWIMFWLLHALNILGHDLSLETKKDIIALLKECKCRKTGAFCGGPFQLPHLAPTYASISALTCLNLPEGYETVDREVVYDFICSMKREDMPGSFKMHENGESDMRSVYCAISVASVLSILDDKISENVAGHIRSCQNYDGGFSAEPFGESHGGYTYCAIASLVLLGEWEQAEMARALEWCTSRQMDSEGGFNGRPNKLVDSCYCFWVGASISILQQVLKIPTETEVFDKKAMQAYVLVACQSPMGLFDKPGSSPDYYHTAYSLAGLSLAQHPSLFKEYNLALPEVDPLLNVLLRNAKDARAYFASLGKINKTRT